VLRVLFFARLREELGCDALELPWREELASLDALQAHLCEVHGDTWCRVLGAANVIRAVNQVVAASDTALAAGDEVAFFPPMTGG
jgi:molybdopterin synthase sulfur carrier subunit